MSNNQNDLNTLDVKKADPSVDKGVDQIEEIDQPNKHVDKHNEKGSKKVPPPLPLPLVIFSHTKSTVWTTSQLVVLY
ncbi:MAG: hypothetical protein WA667_11440 [Candidatus Nitrosopolaris sp.]